MNYVISIIAPERLEILTDLCEGLGLPLTVRSMGAGRPCRACSTCSASNRMNAALC